VSKGNRALDRPPTAAAANTLITAAVARADFDPHGYTAHSLRAGFVTYAHLRGITDRAIAHQTRHRSLATLGIYTRIENAWTTMLLPNSGSDCSMTGMGSQAVVEPHEVEELVLAS